MASEKAVVTDVDVIGVDLLEAVVGVALERSWDLRKYLNGGGAVKI